MGAAGVCSHTGGWDGSLAVVGGCLVVMPGVAGERPSQAHAVHGAGTLGGGAGGGACREPPGLGGYAEPRCAHNQGMPQAPFLPQPPWNLCVLVHVLLPASRAGVCKRFALICLSSKAGIAGGAGCALPPGCGEVMAMQPTWDTEKGPELFPLYLFFTLLPLSSFCLCHASPTRVPSSQRQGCHCCSPRHHSPALLSSGILLQTEKSSVEGCGRSFAQRCMNASARPCQECGEHVARGRSLPGRLIPETH